VDLEKLKLFKFFKTTSTGGPVQQPFAGVNFITQSETVNLATGVCPVVSERNGCKQLQYKKGVLYKSGMFTHSNPALEKIEIQIA
jgi:hypothetical protein